MVRGDHPGRMDRTLPSREDLGPRSRRAWDVLRAIVHEVRVENLPFMAGSIAYHAFVSMLPLLVLLVFAVSSVADATLSDRVLAVVGVVLTPSGRELIVEAVTSGTSSRGISLLGGGLLLWATLRIFRGLDQAFSDVYESEGRNTLLDQIGDALVVLVTVAGTVVAAGIGRSVLRFGSGPLGATLETAVVIVGLAASLFPMFYLFPDTDLDVRGVIPGTVLAAVGITALESLFRVYLELGGPSRSYGVLGAILVLLTWLYLVGFVVLLGAAVNAVLTNRSEDVDIEPVIGDWRPGIGTTFGAPRWDEGTADVVATRIGTVAEAASGDDPVVVSVAGREVRFPPPASVRTDVDGDDPPAEAGAVDRDEDGERGEQEGEGTDEVEGTVGIEFRW